MPRHLEDKVSFPFVFCLSTLCLVMNRDVFLRAGTEREGRHNRGARQQLLGLNMKQSKYLTDLPALYFKLLFMPSNFHKLLFIACMDCIKKNSTRNTLIFFLLRNINKNKNWAISHLCPQGPGTKQEHGGTKQGKVPELQFSSLRFFMVLFSLVFGSFQFFFWFFSSFSVFILVLQVMSGLQRSENQSLGKPVTFF